MTDRAFLMAWLDSERKHLNLVTTQLVDYVKMATEEIERVQKRILELEEQLETAEDC